MNQLSKKAIASILSLVLVFVALGATTFAWFTLGTTATVGNFDLTARGSEGLEISLGDTNQWYSSISGDIMQTYVDGLLTGKNGRLDAVTSPDGTTFTGFGTVESDGTVTPSIDAPVANKEYLEITFKFRTMSRGSKLNLSELTFDSETVNWTPDINFTPEIGGPVDVTTATEMKLKPHYGARVSFTGTETKVFQAETDPANIGFDLRKGAHDYLAKKFSVYSLVEPSHSAFIDSASRFTTSTEIISFTDGVDEEYSTAQTTIRIWYEGWDGNTYDAIFGGKIQFGFKFEVIETPVTP